MRLTQSPFEARTKTLTTGKWKRRLRRVLGLLLVLLVFAPVLIARTPLRNWLVARLTSQLKGEIHVGGASLWWWSAPVLTDIDVRDCSGRTLIHVPRLEGSKTIVGLLCHPRDLGEFHLLQPVLHVTSSRDSTNLESVFEHWMQKKEGSQDSVLTLDGPGLRVELVQASLLLEDEVRGRKWSVEGVELSLMVPQNRRTATQLHLNATISDNQREGRLAAEISANLIEVSGSEPRIRAEGELHVQEAPLDALEPFLRRLEAQLQTAGRLSADVKLVPGTGQPGTPDVRLDGSISIQGFALSATCLGSDVLRLTQVKGELTASLDRRQAILESLNLQTEVGKLNLAGNVDLTKDWRETFNKPGHRIEAELNLARLAGLLPNTLHLAKDTQIRSGLLAFQLRSSLGNDSVLWQGGLHSTDLEGTYQRQHLRWKEPLTIDFTAHQEANGPWPVLERFRCESDFLKVEMSGSFDDWAARGSFNLGRLSEHLAGFVEIGSVKLQGEGTLKASGRRHARGSYRLESDIQLAQLKLSDDGRIFREDGLSIHLNLVGDPMAVGTRILAGGMHVVAGNDGIDLDVLEPISDVQQFRLARLRCRIHGNLTRWRDRLASLTGLLNDVSLGGQFEMDGRVCYESQAIQLEDIKIAARNVQMRGFGLNVEEPSLEFTTSGRWLAARDTLELQLTHLNCSTLSVQAPAVTLAFDPIGSWLITTSATIQGDVARLEHCFVGQAPPHSKPSGPGDMTGAKGEGGDQAQFGGALAGRIDLRPDQGRQVVQLDLNVRNLIVGSPQAPSWRESRLNLTGHGVYDLLKDSFQITQLHLDSPALGCDATGRVIALRSDMELSLNGKICCDWEQLGSQLRPLMGPSVKLSGHDTREFHLSGSLAASKDRALNLVSGPSVPPPLPSLAGRLQGDAGLSWQSLQALGCQIGPAQFRGRLIGGYVKTAPIEATFNQGRLHLEPTLRLDPMPAEITLAKGRVLDHAHVTSDACASALGYALPVLADVAQADGELSLDLDGGRIPLTDPAKAQLSGRLIIHTAQAGAGPLTRELSILLKGPATLTLAQNHVVPFQLVNGRVYHEGLEMRFPELTIRTSGSVGLDGSLALVAEMPVPPKWLGSSRLARSVAGQVIRLPIGGTLNKPKIDEQALRTASAQFAREAAENTIRQELDGKLKKEAESGLRKLLRPRK